MKCLVLGGCGNTESSIAKSVFSRSCSNTTAYVKHKSKDVQPGKPPKWWSVIHDSEGVPSRLRTKLQLS